MNRFLVIVRYHKLLFSLAAVPLLFVSALSDSRQPQAAKDGDLVRLKRINLVVRSQPNSPVTIASRSINSSDPNTPRITIKVVNVSDSPVRAFTVRCDTHFGQSMLSAWSLINIQSIKMCFRPQESRTVIMDDANYSQPPQSALLSVDFVEFLDGSRWGEDTYKSGERLDGLRAGAHSEAESILSKIRTSGTEVALNDVRAKSSDVVAPSNVSVEYSDGFRLGVDAVRARLLQSRGKNKLDDVVNELLRPIDLSDWR